MRIINLNIKQKIFEKNIKIINLINSTTKYIRKQNFYRGLHFSEQVINELVSNIDNIFLNKDYFNKDVLLVDENTINDMLNQLLDAQANKDLVLVADLYDMLLKPFLLSLQNFLIYHEPYEGLCDDSIYEKNIKLLASINESLANKLLNECETPESLLDRGYSVEFTSCGLITLAGMHENTKYYLHSNINPVEEAFSMAEEWFDCNISEYFVYGLGLGYHIEELIKLDNSASITIYEGDINVIQLACACCNLEYILNNYNISINYDPNYKEVSNVLDSLNQNQSLVIHYPSIRNIKNFDIKEQLEDYFINYHSIKNQINYLNINFRNNMRQEFCVMDDIKNEFENKNLFIIAAGPSLDKNFLELKNIPNNSLILATGSVLKKLLSENIIPDFIIISDSTELVYQQIEGLEDLQIPIILLSTAYYKIAKNYNGKKYLVFQESYTGAKEYALENGYRLYESGGSVTCVALDIGIKCNCNRIIFLGLDLAYTNNRHHASNTVKETKLSDKDLRKIKSYEGGYVLTGKNLDIYRKWIENRIKSIKNIELINATEGGAEIEYLKKMNMKDVIREVTNEQI